MSHKKALSRRRFLHGAGNIAIALPFLDAMIPTFARAQSSPQYRYLLSYYGSTNGGNQNIRPAYGALPQNLPRSIRSLQAVKNHITLVSRIDLPQHNSDQIPPPGEATRAQHGRMESPMLSGVRSVPRTATQFENRYGFIRGTTSDQIAAQFLGAGSKFPSLQVKVQASVYNGTGKQGSTISCVKNGSVLNEYHPIISPLELYENLFTSSVSPSSPTQSVSNLLKRKKSILDLILDDANRLYNEVSNEDKQRLELHFESIRQIERSLAANSGGSSTGSASTCIAPGRPGQDPPIDSQGFGGWANETLRGEIQAELIAMAFQCGLTHVASWQLTHHQVWINSNKTSGSMVVPNNGGKPDIHSDSHSAPKDIEADNHNWAVNFYGLLIEKLANMQDSHGSLLDHTYASFVTAESTSAHSRDDMTYIIAGCPHRLKAGQNIDAGGSLPARLHISGLQAIGMNTNTLGEVTGNIGGLHL